MIPSDLAARLRMLTEASFFSNEPEIPGLARAREIQGDLPDLQPGQRFTATIQRPLPDGSFQAIVAGRTYTLALSHPAQTGDTLELVVTRNSPRAVFAERPASDIAPQTLPQSAGQPTLSATGRLISFLLTGRPAPAPTPLAGGQPLLPTPPQHGAALAPLLRQALGQSGLFYEAHQAQWIAGQRDTALLAAEPQGRQAASGMAAATPAGAGAAAATAPPLLPQAGAADTPTPDAAHAARLAGESAAPHGPAGTGQLAHEAEASRTGASPTLPDTAAVSERGPEHHKGMAIPEPLLPLVHQQLDTLATHQLVVQAQAWPGQTMEWSIEEPDDDSAGERREGETDEGERSWKTTLRLRLPRLGGIEARVQLTPAGVAVRLLSDDEATATALGGGREALENALAAADVPLTGFIVETPHGGQ